jgi:hypothetical protein
MLFDTKICLYLPIQKTQKTEIMECKVIQTQNENGRFTYKINDLLAIGNSKKDYSFALVCKYSKHPEWTVLKFSSKKNQSDLNFWLKNAGSNLVVDCVQFVKIQK